MSIIVDSNGNNSISIEYSQANGSTWREIIEAIDSYITTKGWIRMDPDFHDGTPDINPGWYDQMTYKSLCKDGSYKYMQLSHNNGSYIRCLVFEDYNVDTKSYGAISYQSEVTTFAQNFNPTTQSGKLYIFASQRIFVMFNEGENVGSYEGSGCTGCLEIETTYDEDKSVSYGWFNSYYFCRYCAKGLTMPRSNKYIGNYGHNRMQTPIATFGYNAVGSLINGIPNTPLPEAFGTGLHHTYDFHLSIDENQWRMYKGRIFGIKSFTSKMASPGDIFSVKCDVDGFIDPDGTSTDHFIFDNNSYGAVGIPL